MIIFTFYLRNLTSISLQFSRLFPVSVSTSARSCVASTTRTSFARRKTCKPRQALLYLKPFDRTPQACEVGTRGRVPPFCSYEAGSYSASSLCLRRIAGDVQLSYRVLRYMDHSEHAGTGGGRDGNTRARGWWCPQCVHEHGCIVTVGYAGTVGPKLAWLFTPRR